MDSQIPGNSPPSPSPVHSIHLPHLLQEWKKNRKPIVNPNQTYLDSLSPLDKLATKITSKVGSMGFFFLILIWTILWCGYNIVATEFTSLHLKAFDPFPAFVAYLLISNVIQILLMPLIMVGQEVQGRHSEIRAQSDFEINQKAEKEVEMMLYHQQMQQQMLLELAIKQGMAIDELLARVEKAVGPAPASSST